MLFRPLSALNISHSDLELIYFAFPLCKLQFEVGGEDLGFVRKTQMR